MRLVNEEANIGVGGLDLRAMLVLRREVRYGSVFVQIVVLVDDLE